MHLRLHFVGALLLATAACNDDEEDATMDERTDDVVEVAIRRLNAGQDVRAFEQARDAFVTLLRGSRE